MRVASLHVYPVKGASGIALETAEMLRSGVRHDRRFMVLDTEGNFVTQRRHPRMALVRVRIDSHRDGEQLVLSTSLGTVSVPLVPRDGEGSPRRVRIWNDDVDAIDLGGEGAAFFSEHLRQSCSFVFMPLSTTRLVEAPHGRPGDRVGFADAYPVLIASLASLADLNERLVSKGARSIPMNRFRPNIVVEGGEAFAEDRATAMRVGGLTLRTPKRCSRCQVTTVDQTTGEASKEPLKTLASYRSEGKHVWFAMNGIPELGPDATQTIAVGEDVSYV
jgi:uncharacterized protein